MDRLEAIEVFAAVADAGGFSAASRRLRMPLATVSRKVAELEEHLGAQLLKRSTRRVVLTETGQQYLVTCRRVLDELGEAERMASGEHRAPRGELVVAAPAGLGRLYLAPIVIEFLAGYPDIDVDLRLSDSIVNILDGQIDVALRVAHLEDSSLIALRIGEIRQVVCASPAYLAARGTPVALADITGHDCVTFTSLGTSKEWIFRHGRKSARVPVRSRFSVSTADAAVDAAAAGVGLTRLLCYQASAAIAAKRLRVLLREHEPEPLPVSLVYPSGRLIPQKLRAFLDFVVPRLKRRLVFDP